MRTATGAGQMSQMEDFLTEDPVHEQILSCTFFDMTSSYDYIAIYIAM